MDIKTLKNFFMWCTILNGALLFLSAISLTLLQDCIYRLQSQWYPVSREAFNIAIYSFIGLFKLFFIVFSLVPYIALSIIDKKNACN